MVCSTKSPLRCNTNAFKAAKICFISGKIMLYFTICVVKAYFCYARMAREWEWPASYGNSRLTRAE